MRVVILCLSMLLAGSSCGMLENLGFAKISLGIEEGRVTAIASELNVPVEGLSAQAIEAWYEEQTKTDVTITETPEGFQVEAPSDMKEVFEALVKVPGGGFTAAGLVAGGIAAFSALAGIYKRRKRIKDLAAAPTTSPGGVT